MSRERWYSLGWSREIRTRGVAIGLGPAGPVMGGTVRRLVFLVLVIVFGLGSAVSYAQTSPAKPAPQQTVKTVDAAPAPSVFDDSRRLLAIGLAAIGGTVVATVFSANVISSSALANLGKGAVVFVGTVAGGLIGNWLAQH